ncbi:MAG TPA: glucose-6-phosphate isomerase [Deltaproteobacteria bacterium]|jgi:glucose-6-phosphate isomerase|nr:glucose-6-phosphate isomerase [Deltaproteobacteria bacterium]
MKLAGMDFDLTGFEQAVMERLKNLEEDDLCARLWKKDPALWKMEPDQQKIIANSMGWLDSPEKIRQAVPDLTEFAAELKKSGFRHVLLMGMGGSSLAPLVFRETFGRHAPGLPLTVLDTTDPATVIRLERSLPLGNTFFIEASKSGTTVESRSFGEYFFERVKSIKANLASENFGVITDPGSRLERLAAERSYRKVFLNYPDIGGRYSALSFFGLAPASLIGIDLDELLVRASKMLDECRMRKPLSQNPGVALGVAIGVLAAGGRDKLTFLLPGPICSFSMWLEQLIAESTGKDGTGVIPVSGDPVETRQSYGEDRLFVEFRITNEPDEALEATAHSLRKAAHPVITVYMRDRLDLGEQFFLWEIATATVGALLNINPFDQPNVQEAKEFTAKILDEVNEEGRVPEAGMEMSHGPLRLYLAGGASSVPQALALFFEGAARDGYLGILAYLTENETNERGLRRIRILVRDRMRIATTVGYGPRYLHSTGQLHKGGTNKGFFLMLTSDIAEDTGIPGQPYTFGMLMRAQALGDFEALRKHRRRVLRVHLSGETPMGLAALEELLRSLI